MKTPVSPQEREEVYTMIHVIADLMDVAGEHYRDRLPEVYFDSDGLESFGSVHYDPETNEIYLKDTGEDNVYEAAVRFVRQFVDGMPETTDLFEAMGKVILGEKVDPAELRTMAKRSQRELKEDRKALKGYIGSMKRMGKRAEQEVDVISEVIDLATRGDKKEALRYLDKHRKDFDEVTYSTLRESIEDGTIGSD